MNKKLFTIEQKRILAKSFGCIIDSEYNDLYLPNQTQPLCGLEFFDPTDDEYYWRILEAFSKTATPEQHSKFGKELENCFNIMLDKAKEKQDFTKPLTMGYLYKDKILEAIGKVIGGNGE